YKYPAAVEKAADKIPEEIPEEEIAGREDFRKVTTFTIDPKDAKDFDDALSVRKRPNGHWEIGVHIADVTHYVKPDSIIEREAVSRATSVYLVDRTIPMLPERLSNLICSLRPDEEKLCFSAIFELDGNAEVKNYRIKRTVIKSDRRFTYEEAQQIIETGEGDFKEEILATNELAKKLRAKRFREGAINFDRYEVKFEIDENGKPLAVYFKEAKDANKLIEEFMLLANKTVAEYVGRIPKGKAPKTFVYRIHDLPDPDKMEHFAEFVRRFGYKVKTEGEKSDVSKGINKLLDTIQGKPEENLIETLAIRAMQKARYATENVGHYGLAFEYYTHFTSPIRRYPDMMAHRLLERYLAGGRSVVKTKYEELCEHCSSMEQIAANAERASIKYKQVEFMSDKVGRVFDGVISGVTEWGLYVELNENKCEGLAPIRDLLDDYYVFDDKNYTLTGRRHKHQFRLGDPITVKVAQANLERKQLDFTLV
ncbi:MAG: ribonuclease R, partial [Tannerellaceae bacterium]|nr:ribonuclease R [Tannerellaceae bacterium]